MRLKHLQSTLAGKSSEAKAKFWIELAGKIVEVLADGRVTLAEAVALAQIVYQEFSKKNNMITTMSDAGERFLIGEEG